ncbi:hypothetical protein [Flavobacterium sp.]|uniref:hypothetical protein n=1 Tax=Flavobacterium sp. TaxID=239 RepID=UPI0031D09865
MRIITIEDFRKAVKAHYEIVKHGEYSNHFDPPSPANLRKLCLKIFRSINNQDDLDTFFLFFGFNFDGTRKNLFKDDLHKFKPIGAFLRGETTTPTEDTIYFTAILVNFQPRPFNKFKKEIGDEELKIIRETKDILVPHESIDKTTNEDSQNIEEEVKQEQKNENAQILTDTAKTTYPSDVKPKSLVNLPKTLKYIGFTTVSTFCLIAVYFMFFYKPCMQWSGDHFEKVSCDLEVNGIGNFNVVEPFDKTIFDLKKINVCDTTPCFDKNGEAVVWYAKTANGIDFFNGHGRHPETNSPLRPVTRYILNKYVKK